MCPGLTSPGGNIVDCEEGEFVAIHAEDKEHALAIGVTMMSSEEIKSVNKGIGIHVLHYVGDGLWTIDLD